MIRIMACRDSRGMERYNIIHEEFRMSFHTHIASWFCYILVQDSNDTEIIEVLS